MAKKSIVPGVPDKSDLLDRDKLLDEERLALLQIPPPGKKKRVPLDDQKAAVILAMLADGKTLGAICRSSDMPDRADVYYALRTDPVFARAYLAAQQDRAEILVEQIIEIADDQGEDPASRKVRVDARKWVAGKLDPRRYSDRAERLAIEATAAGADTVFKISWESGSGDD